MPGRPSSWVNLQDYLSLNADQGADMGQRVYGDVSAKAGKAQEQLGQDTTGYSGAVQQGTVAGPKGDGSQYTEDQAAANAQKAYSGPKSLDEYDPTLAGNVNQASLDVQAAADPNQRGSVIQETFGGQGASGVGGSALDSFLTGASPAGAQLAGLGKQYQGLLSNLGLAETDAYGKGQLASEQSSENANKWAQLGTSLAAKKAAAADPTKDLSDAPDSSGRKGLSQKQEAGLQNWYHQMVSKVASKYVGDGKQFKTEKDFENYLGGIGHGAEETLGVGGAVNSGDRTIMMLSTLGRVAYGGGPIGGGQVMGGGANQYIPLFLGQMQKYSSTGALPDEWAQNYRAPTASK